MAVLNKLRNSKWVLIIVLVSLLLFIVTDYFSSNSKFGFKSDQNVGTIAGNDISLIEFDARYKNLLNQITSNGSSENESSRDQASNFAWNQFIQQFIIDKEYEKLGVDVSVEEAGKLLYSDDAHATIKQYFSRDGQFSPSYVLNFKNQIAKKDPKMMAQFELIVKQVIMEVQNRKYNSLISKSLYATSLDAEDDFLSSAATYTGKSISLNFANIEDKTIKVEESELKAYIKDHKEDYQQKASRDLEYVLFSITPSADDTLATKEDLESIIADFRETENDSAFVALNSMEAFSNEFQSHGSFRKEIESTLFTLKKDSVIGPIYFEGGYSLYKAIDQKQDSVYYYHALKVDLPVKGTTKQDTLDAIASGKKLGQESNSASNSLEFFQAKSNTGEVTYAQDLGWLREGTQTEEINKAIQLLNVGQSTVVKSIYGLSIIKLLEPKSSELIKIAEVRKQIIPQTSTEDKAFQKASDFRSALNGNSEDEFDASIKKMGLNKSVANGVKESDKMMTAIPGTIDVIRWAYNTERKIGDYSDVIVNDNMLIVARLVSIKKEGLAELEDVRDRVTMDVKNEKKAAIYIKQINDAKAKSKTMEELATNLQAMVQPFYNVNFYSTSVQFCGNDPKMVGYVCGLKLNEISKPIASREGVHVLMVENQNIPEIPKDLESRKLVIYDQKKQQIYNTVFDALKKTAKVEDNRFKYY